MATKTHKGKRVKVEISHELRRHVDRLMRTTYRDITERLERETSEVRAQGAAAWPVKSGDSRRSLKTETRFEPPNKIVSVVLSDPTVATNSKGRPYAYLVREAGQTKGTAWSTKVVRPGRSARRRNKLIADLQDALLKAADRG